MLTADGRNREAIEARIQLAHETAYGLMGAGLHGLNGVNPGFNVKVLNTYVIIITRFTFGLKALTLDRNDINQFENSCRTYTYQAVIIWLTQHLLQPSTWFSM